MRMHENGNHIGRISLIIIIAFIVLLLSRMVVLNTSQSINRKRYSDPVVSSSLVRGTIYDRNGNPLAFQAPDYGFNVHLSTIDSSYVASIIAPYLSFDALEIESMIDDGITFFPLSYIPTKEEGEYLERLLVNFALDKEVSLELKEIRKHPSGINARKYIGDVDEYLNGISGIEKLYDKELKAIPRLGYNVEKGSSLVLTLDQDLQFALNRVPNLDDYQNSTIAILSDSDEILAYQGKADDKILNAMVYSITTGENTTILEHKSPFNDKDIERIGRYKVYVDSPSEIVRNSIINGIESALVSLGRIPVSSY